MPRKIQDPSHQRKKSLKISTTVHGREKIGNRVVYHVDNNDESSPKKMQKLLFYTAGKE